MLRARRVAAGSTNVLPGNAATPWTFLKSFAAALLERLKNAQG